MMTFVLSGATYCANPKLVHATAISREPMDNILACPHLSTTLPATGDVTHAAIAYVAKIIPVQTSSMPKSFRIVGKNGLASP